MTTTTLPRRRLILIALGMLAIYVVYVIAFPLLPNIMPGRPAYDVESLMRPFRWFAPIYVLGLFALFGLFWLALRTVHQAARAAPEAALKLRTLVLGSGGVFGAALIFLYPITALDVFLYVVMGRTWAVYGQSPLMVAPAAFPNDPITAYAGEFASAVSPYGPLWEIIVQIPMRLGATDIASGVIAMKVIALIAYLACGALIGWWALPEGKRYPVSRLVALTFWAWNPLVLMQGIGNGHNDVALVALIVLGLVLWQREHRLWAGFALTLAMLVKLTGAILIPIYGIALLRSEPTWRGRIRIGLIAIAMGLITAAAFYRLLGPFPDVFQGNAQVLFQRRGFAPASAVRMILREFLSPVWSEPLARSAARDLFVVYYAYLLIRVWRGHSTLISAAYMAFFSQLMLGATFRIWYPMWLVPLAALHLTSRTGWRTLLFGLTAELSILSYFVLWRWVLRSWGWGTAGPLGPYWNYWTIMTVFTVPWTFGIPLVAPMIRKWRDRKRFVETLWI